MQCGVWLSLEERIDECYMGSNPITLPIVDSITCAGYCLKGMVIKMDEN